MAQQTRLSEIDAFLAETGLSEYRFGFLAAQNGRLVDRLRANKRIWPETEVKVRAFMLARRAKSDRASA